MSTRIRNFCKDEAVLCIAALAALSTMFLIPPDGAYLAYIDLRVLCLLLCVSVSARAQTEITGSDSALVADFVQLEIAIPGQEYSKVSFRLSFDTTQVQLLGLSASQGWELTILGQAVTLDRGDGAATDIHLQLRLRILPVPAQTKIRVAVSDVTGYREGEQALLGDASHEMTVTEPLSSDNFLTELSVEEGTLAPAFHRDITQYTATGHDAAIRFIFL